MFDKLALTLKSIEVCAVGSLIKTISGKMSREENMKRYAARSADFGDA